MLQYLDEVRHMGEQIEECDVAVVIALEEEYLLLRKELIAQGGYAEGEPTQVKTSVFHAFVLPRHPGPRWIVTYLEDDRSIAGTRVATERLLSRWKPKVLVSFGISGAAHGDVKLGDIVIATSCLDYLHRSKIPDSASIGNLLQGVQLGGQELSTDEPLMRTFEQFRTAHATEYSDWRAEAEREIAKLSPATAEVVHTARSNVPPALLTGPVASGPWVVSNADFKTWLKVNVNRNVLAVDTESFGVLKSANDDGRVCQSLIVRAISDNAQQKSAFDELDGGAIRAWVLTNAARLLIRLLTHVRWGAASVTPPEPWQRSSPRSLHELIVAKWCGGRAPSSPSDEVVRLFEHVTQEHDPFERVLERVQASTRTTFLIDGEAGTGKTSFLRLLYMKMYQASLEGSPSVPVFVDASRYDKLNDANEARAEWRKDASAVLAAINAQSDRTFVFLVDSVDSHHSYANAILDELGKWIRGKEGRIKRIVSMRGSDDENTALLGRVEPVLTTRSVSVDAGKINEFLSLFISCEGEAGSAQALQSQLKKYQLTRVDLRILRILAKDAIGGAYARAASLSAFLGLYCQKLGLDTGQLAKQAFEHFVIERAKPGKGSIPSASARRVLYEHPIMRDYLIAYHVVELLRRYAKAGEGGMRHEHLDYVYPSSIMRRVKEVINVDAEDQAIVLRALMHAHTTGSPRMLSVLCYLVGRLQEKQQIREAHSYLGRVVSRFKNVSETEESRLALRSAYVALMNLGDERSHSDYISELLRNKRSDSLNRGFHLEYYGDIPFRFDMPLCNADNLVDCSRTFEHLLNRVRAGMNGQPSHLFQLEAYTLCSLARHRHATAPQQVEGSEPRIQELHRREICEIASRLRGRADLVPLRQLRDYFWAVETDLSIENFRIGLLAEVAFRLKDIPRTGWILRGIEPCESVAGHVFGAYVLGLLFLPSTHPDITYNKQQVLRIIMVHDLAEAITGDVPSPDKTPSHREEERKWMAYLSAASSYEGIGEDVAEILSLYDAYKNGSDTNAKVARELDKIDNLLQLHIYGKRGLRIDDEQGWSADLEREIESPQARNIIKALQPYFQLRSPQDLRALAPPPPYQRQSEAAVKSVSPESPWRPRS